LTDFSHWSGISMQEVKPLRALLESKLVEIPGTKSLLLREDVPALNSSPAAKPCSCVRLLPLFDPYLLAHRDKDHLLSPQHYKRVYRNQGWISPVVLIDGSIAAIWSHKLQRRLLIVKIEPFDKLTRTARAAIEREAGQLAQFFESTPDLKFA
jgi:hypothetical protein